jgi:hypothetical protein
VGGGGGGSLILLDYCFIFYKKKDKSNMSSPVFTSDPLLDVRYPYLGVDNAAYQCLRHHMHASLLLTFFEKNIKVLPFIKK